MTHGEPLCRRRKTEKVVHMLTFISQTRTLPQRVRWSSSALTRQQTLSTICLKTYACHDMKFWLESSGQSVGCHSFIVFISDDLYGCTCVSLSEGAMDSTRLDISLGGYDTLVEKRILTTYRIYLPRCPRDLLCYAIETEDARHGAVEYLQQ